MSVTNDVQVLKKMKFKTPRTSATLAAGLGLTVFQITARLASMEKRGLVKRTKDRQGWLKLKKWRDVEREQEAEVINKAKRVAAWKAGLPPEAVTDDGVPVIADTRGWHSRDVAYAEDRWALIFRDPETGTEYIRANPFQKAHIIRSFPDLPPVRLSKYDKKHRVYQMVEDYHKSLEALLAE